MQGKIVKGIAGFYYVHVVESGVYECKAKGIFRKDGVKPLVGDNVEIGCGSVLNPGTIVGKETNVYPLSSVRGVIPEHSIYKKHNEIVDKID